MRLRFGESDFVVLTHLRGFVVFRNFDRWLSLRGFCEGCPQPVAFFAWGRILWSILWISRRMECFIFDTKSRNSFLSHRTWDSQSDTACRFGNPKCGHADMDLWGV